MYDTDTANVDVNTKAEAPDASEAPKIDTNKIDVKRGIETKCSALISHY